jgi:autophagy-related protein 18
MLFSTSLVAVCGTGSTPSLSPRVCKLLNTSTRRCIADLAHASTILAVRMDRHALVVVEATRATVYSMQSLNVQRVIDTIANPRGIVALSACERSSTLALPSLGSGGGGTGGEGAASRRGGVVVHDCVNHLRRVLPHTGPRTTASAW